MDKVLRVKFKLKTKIGEKIEKKLKISGSNCWDEN